MHRITTLGNGLKVITDRMINAHSLSIGLWIRTGGRYEAKQKQGISHFMEHMLFKGTSSRSCQRLKQAIEEKGGVFNAFTSEECVCYYIKILSEHLDLASDILTDMVLRPALTAEDIEKERKVIFEEIRMYLDLPMQYVQDMLDELIWPNHPLGRSLLGTYDTVDSIKRSDLKEQKERFHIPNNIVAVACGDIEHDIFLKSMERLFRDIRPANILSFDKIAPATTQPRTRFYHKGTEQTHLALGVRSMSRKHPDRFALSALNTVLGGNMSSRLFNEIREKRSLAYEIGSAVKRYSDTGLFYIHAGVDNKKVKDAVSIMMKELKKIKARPISKKELEMAKEYCRSGLLMILENNMSNMLFLGEQMTSIGRVIKKEEVLRKLSEINVEMVNGVADRIFTDKNLKLAMIGPQTEKEKSMIRDLLYF